MGRSVCGQCKGSPKKGMMTPPGPHASWGSISISVSVQHFMQRPFSAHGLGVNKVWRTQGPQGTG